MAAVTTASRDLGSSKPPQTSYGIRASLPMAGAAYVRQSAANGCASAQIEDGAIPNVFSSADTKKPATNHGTSVLGDFLPPSRPTYRATKIRSGASRAKRSSLTRAAVFSACPENAYPAPSDCVTT